MESRCIDAASVVNWAALSARAVVAGLKAGEVTPIELIDILERRLDQDNFRRGVVRGRFL